MLINGCVQPQKRLVSKDGKIYGYQFLRGICCLGILLAHSCYFAEVNFLELSEGDLMIPGRLGMLNYVIFFFVLSGYLTAKQIHEGGGTARKHLTNRFWSIYPQYWCALSVVILIRLVCFNELQVGNNFWECLLILPGNIPYLCMVEWTLTYQIVFYVVTAIFYSKHTKKLYPLFCLAIVAIIYAVKFGVMPLQNGGFKDVLMGRDALLWIFLGSTMYYLSYALNSITKYDRVNTTSTVKQMIVGIVIVGLFLIITNDIGPYILDSFWQYVKIYMLVFLVILLLPMAQITQKSIVIIIAKHSMLIYLIHTNMLNGIFFELNKHGIHYHWTLHFIVVVATLLVLMVFSYLLNPAFVAIRENIGRTFHNNEQFYIHRNKN